MCFFHFFSSNKVMYLKKTDIKWKRKRFYSWALHYFFKFLLFNNVLWTTNMRPYGWIKNCTLYMLRSLILFNPFHLTVGSKLILTENEIWVSEYCAHSRVFWLCIGLSNDAIKFSFIAYYDTSYTSLFLVKRLTHSVLSPFCVFCETFKIILN
jgi:hypothetical protein